VLQENSLDGEIKKKKRRFLLVALLVPFLTAGAAVTLPQLKPTPPLPTAVAEAAGTIGAFSPPSTSQPTATLADAGLAPASTATATSTPTDTPSPSATPTLVAPSELPPTGAGGEPRLGWVAAGVAAWLLGALLWWAGEARRNPLED
jgi:hypothetical protein